MVLPILGKVRITEKHYVPQHLRVIGGTIKKENERDTEKYLKIEVVNNIDLYLDKILDGYNPILNVKNLKTLLFASKKVELLYFSF